MAIVGKMSKEELKRRLAEMRAYNQENPTDGMWYNPENPNPTAMGKAPKPPKPPKAPTPPSVEQLSVLLEEQEQRTVGVFDKLMKTEKFKAEEERKAIRAEIAIGLAVALEKTSPEQGEAGVRKATLGTFGLKDLEDPEVMEKAITIMANIRRVGDVVGIKDYMTGKGPIGQQKPTKMLGSVVSALKRDKKESTLLDKSSNKKKEREDLEHRKRMEKFAGTTSGILSKIMPDWLRFMSRNRGFGASSVLPSKKMGAGLGTAGLILGALNSGDKNNLYGIVFDAIMPKQVQDFVKNWMPQFVKDNKETLTKAIAAIALATAGLSALFGGDGEGGDGIGVGTALALGAVGSKIGSILKFLGKSVAKAGVAGVAGVAGYEGAKALGADDQQAMIAGVVSTVVGFMVASHLPKILGAVLVGLTSGAGLVALAGAALAVVGYLGWGYLTDGTVTKMIGSAKLAKRDPVMVKKVAKATGKKEEDLTDDDFAKYIDDTQSFSTRLANFFRGKEGQQFHLPDGWEAWSPEEWHDWMYKTEKAAGRVKDWTPPPLPPVKGTELDDVKPRVPVGGRVPVRKGGSSKEQDDALKAKLREIPDDVSKDGRVPSMYGKDFDAPRLNWNQRRVNDRLQGIDKKPEGVQTRKDKAAVIIDNSVKNSNNTTAPAKGGAPAKHGVGSATAASPNPMMDMALWGVPSYNP